MFLPLARLRSLRGRRRKVQRLSPAKSVRSADLLNEVDSVLESSLAIDSDASLFNIGQAKRKFASGAKALRPH